MTAFRTRIALAASLLFAGGCAYIYDRAGETFATSLAGGREVPGPGDRDASGIAEITIDSLPSQICFRFDVRKLAPATAAHVHRGRVGEAGPPIVTLKPPDADGNSQGCRGVGRALARELVATPDEFYVNIHNAEFPAGAVRGQLARGR